MSVKVLQAEPGPCDYCSAIDGQSELSRNRSIGSLGTKATPIPTRRSSIFLPLHTGTMTERPHSGTVPYTEGPCTHPTALRTPQATNLEHNQDATSDLSHHCTVSDRSLITKC